jgi:hypothetical protein
VRGLADGCVGVEQPLRQRVFAAILAIAVLVDLSAYDPALFALWGPRQFHMPWLAAWPGLGPDETNVLFVRGATLLACIGASALYWGRRWGAWPALALYGYVFLDHQPGYTNNGYLLLIMLGVAAASALTGTTPVWPRRVGQVALSAMYLGAGLSKLTPAFLSGDILGQALVRYGHRYASWFGWDEPWLFTAGAYAAAALELTLAVGLWFPRTHRVLIPIGLAFHLGIEALMPVRFFLFVCAAGYVLFMDATVLGGLVSRARRIAHPVSWLVAIVGIAVALEKPIYGVATTGAVLVACSIVFGALAFRRGRREPATTDRTPPRRLAIALVCAMIAVQLFCIIKPALGLSKRFAWQMFSEALIMRVDTQVMSDGRFRSATFPGADTRWRTDGFRYHWTSWSEERIYLAGYARWLAETFELREVRVLVRYRLNGGPERQASFTGHNPLASQ